MSSKPWKKKHYGIARERHRAKVERDQKLSFSISPPDAIAWLIQRSKTVKLGTNHYQDIVYLIRRLISERATLQIRVDNLETQIDNPPESPKKLGTEGQGQWDDSPIGSSEDDSTDY